MSEPIIDWRGRRMTLRRFYWTVTWPDRLRGVVMFLPDVLWNWRGLGWSLSIKCFVWRKRYWECPTTDPGWVESWRAQ